MQDLERLVGGFQRFQQQYYEDAPSLYRNLRDGQHPSSMAGSTRESQQPIRSVLGCWPSRRLRYSDGASS